MNRNEMIVKMIEKYGFEHPRTIKMAQTAENKDFSQKHVEIVFQALYN